MSKCGLCAHITHEFLVITEAKPWDKRKRDLIVLGKRDQLGKIIIVQYERF